jgi:uncharacterized protein YqjF (DUF2071 family)
MTKTFLQAEWRKLVIANYSVDRKLLEKYLPRNTEIDLWNDTCYVSLVGFMFLNTKVKGLRIPFHVNFEEVNLRFYVRFKDNGEWKRGVVFIKEIVPKPVLAFVANTVYKENYETMPMSHSWTTVNDNLLVEYKWKKSKWNSLKVIADKNKSLIKDGSEEEFITEHYWGYTKITKDKTSEYGVEHPQWEVYQTKDYLIDVDFGDVYGCDFNSLTNEKPKSVFLAEGSLIKVKDGRHI